MTALLCPGQGAQYRGMGREFAERWPSAAEIFRRADEALGRELSRTLFEGDDEEVQRTDVCQPGILTVTMAIWTVLCETGKADPAELSAAVGLSLGEYTAHCVAGTIGFEDAVRLVERRGRYMQEASEATPSGMAAVLGLDRDACELSCAAIRAEGGVVVVANLNAPGQVVVSGERRALDELAEDLLRAGAKRVVPLKVAGAFHSPVMAPAAERLAADLAEVSFRAPSVPVWSNVTAEPVRTPQEARDTLAKQVVAPVLLEASLRGVLARGERSFVEPGPGRTLAGFVRKIDRDAKVRGYDAAADVDAN